MTMFEGRYFCTDASGGEINVDANDGITTDDDGGLQFDWDAQPTVSADKLPDSYTQFYDADEFVKISNVTVAKPIKQQYRINGDEYTFEKTEGELRKAAWSFDNSPHPLEHPDSGRVRSVDDIHGFWKNPRYVDDEGVVSNLYIPANDAEALSYVSEHGDVSIGFTNRLVSSDEDGVDAIQTDIYGDHIASVRKGRCSGEDGCGLNADSSIMPMDDESDTTIDTTMTDGTTDGCGCGGDGGQTIDLGDALPGMSVDALADRNEAVEKLREEKTRLESDAEDAREALESVREALDADEGTDLSSELESLTSELEDAQSKLAEQYREEFDSIVEDITSVTDKTEDDFEFETDSPEESVEKVRETKELLDSVEATPTDTDSTTETTDSTGGSSGSTLKPRYETQY